MTRRLLPVLFALMPLIALFSGIGMTTLFYLIFISICCAIPVAKWRTPEIFYPHYTRLLTGLSLLVLPFMITPLWSITPDASFSTAICTLVLCIAGLAAFVYCKALPVPSNRVVAWYGAALIVMCLLIIQESWLEGGMIKWFYDQMQKDYTRFILKNINRSLCALALLVWPLLAACYERGYKYQGWFVVGLATIAIMSMHSLSAKIGIIAGILCFLALHTSPRIMPRIIVVAIPLLLFALPWLYLWGEDLWLTHPFFQQNLAESSIHRLHIWHVLWQCIEQKLWLGWGIDATRSLPLTADQLAYLALGTPPLHPHNPSIQLLIEGGMLCLMISIVGLALLLREWVHSTSGERLHRTAAGTIIISYLTTNLFSFSFWQFWWIATFCLTAVLWRWLSLKRPITA